MSIPIIPITRDDPLEIRIRPAIRRLGLAVAEQFLLAIVEVKPMIINGRLCHILSISERGLQKMIQRLQRAGHLGILVGEGERFRRFIVKVPPEPGSEKTTLAKTEPGSPPIQRTFKEVVGAIDKYSQEVRESVAQSLENNGGQSTLPASMHRVWATGYSDLLVEAEAAFKREYANLSKDTKTLWQHTRGHLEHERNEHSAIGFVAGFAKNQIEFYRAARALHAATPEQLADVFERITEAKRLGSGAEPLKKLLLAPPKRT